MKKQEYLERHKSGIWYYRRPIIAELQKILKKTQFKQSLKTRDFSIAKQKAIEIEREHSLLFDQIKRRNADVTEVQTLTDKELTLLAVQWLKDMEDGTAQSDKDLSLTNAKDAALEIEYEDLGNIQDESAQAIARKLLRRHLYPDYALPYESPATRKLLKLPPDELTLDKATVLKLANLIKHAAIEHSKRAISRLKGNKRNEYFDETFKGVFANMPLPSGGAGKPGLSIPLEELFNQFLNDPTKRNVAPKHKPEFERIVNLFLHFVGRDKLAKDLTRQNCWDFRDNVLLKMPIQRGKKAEASNYQALIAEKEAKNLPGLSITTVNKAISKVSAFLNWCDKKYNDQGFSNPGRYLKLPYVVGEERKYASMSSTQLQVIFNSPIYTQNPETGINHRSFGIKNHNTGWYWIPLIGLFQGMRAGEICQLFVGDITEIDGIWAIVKMLDKEGRKRLKTAASHGVIPIHPILIKMGFLDFIEKQKKRPADARLFPEIMPDSYIYPSHHFSKEFGDFFKKTGCKTSDTCFHSFRHSFRDALREVGTSEERVVALGGWSATKGQFNGYGDGLKLKTLSREISKLEYEGLDLSHLYKDTPHDSR